MKAIYLSAILLSAASASMAQTLSKEIVIEKDIAPKQNDAKRREISPSISLPAVKNRPLTVSEGASSTEVPSWVTTLEPAQADNAIGNSPYRGYVSAGYFPHPIAGLSAGYRAISTDATALDIFGQFTFNRYKRDNSIGNSVAVRRSALTLGTLLRQRVGSVSMLGLDLDWTLHNFNNPTLIDNGANQRANNVNLSLDWDSRVGIFDYKARVGYGYFGFANTQEARYSYVRNSDNLKALNENRLNILLGASTAGSEVSTVGIDAEAQFAIYNSDALMFVSSDPATAPALTPGDGFTRGFIGVNPYYSYNGGKVDARIGLKASFSIHSGKVVHISPDINISWRPATILGIWAKATGGEQLNSLTTLFNDMPYLSAVMAPAHNSDIAYDISGGFNIGPCRGFTGKLYGGYASAKDWMMPVGAAHGANGDLYHRFERVDMKGWHFGVSAAYDYKGIVGAEVAFEMAPSSYDQGYYPWRDRAKRVLSASINCRPIRPLRVEIGYRLRSGRASYELVPAAVLASMSAYYPEAVPVRHSLGNVSDLSVDAAYDITRRLSVFCNINNILGGDWQEYYGITTAPINGLIGVGYKF